MKLKNINLTLLSAALSLALFSCGNHAEEGGVKTVKFDYDELKTVPFDPSALVALEASDSSLIYDVIEAIPYNNEYYVWSRDFLKRFDAQSGKYKGELAKRGEGPGEFSRIGRIWVDSDTLRLFDSDTKQLNNYLPDGTFCGQSTPFPDMPESEGLKLSAQTFFEAPDGNGYYILNGYIGSRSTPSPAYTRYPTDTKASIVSGRGLRSGSHTLDRGFTDREHNRLLLWEAARDTLFVIDDSHEVRPLYACDFGEHSLPADKQNLAELYERAEAVKAGKDIPYLAFLRYFQSVGDRIYFSFLIGERGAGFGMFDEKTGKTSLITLNGENGRYKPAGFIKIIGDSALVAIHDDEDDGANPALYTFPLTAFE